MKGHEAAALVFGLIAALCLGVAGECAAVGGLGVLLGVCGVVAWLWKPKRRRT